MPEISQTHAVSRMEEGMKLRTTFAVLGTIALGLATSGAQALPAAKTLDTGAANANVQLVDARSYRHCHWRDGRRWCHGGYAYRARPYYGYYDDGYYGPRYYRPYYDRRYYGPGVGVGVGPFGLSIGAW
jgi:hypothetical protein